MELKQQTDRVSISRERKDLRELTDATVYISPAFLNFCALISVLGVSFFLGWMGWGGDIESDYKTILDQHQHPVRLMDSIF